MTHNMTNRTLLGGIVAVSVALVLVLAVDALPWLRGTLGWQWPRNPVPLGRAVPLLIAVTVYCGGAGLIVTRTRQSSPVLLWAALGVIVLPLTVIALRSDDVLSTLFTRTASSLTTGTHYAAAEIDWAGGAWRDWIAVTEDAVGRIGHVPVSPPGFPTVYALLNGILSRLPGPLLTALATPLLPYQCHNYTLLAYTPAQWASAWVGVLMPVWAALTVIPLDRVTRRVMSAESARLVTLWLPLIPALAVFVPLWSMLFPLFSLLAFWPFDIGLRERRRGWLVGAGIVTGVLLWLNYAFLPLLAVFGFYTWAVYLRLDRRDAPPPSWLRPLIVGGWFGLGIVIVWGVYWLLTGQTFFEILLASLNLHFELDRPYAPWVVLHIWDWVLWLGLPVALLWLADTPPTRERTSLLSIALLLGILLLALSGTSRGETGRVWQVFTPFALIAALAGLERLVGAGRLNRAWVGLMPVQAVLLIVLAITLDGVAAADMTPPPAPPAPLTVTHTTDATFADSFTLVGWDAATDANTITLRLNWVAHEQMTTPYWFSALLLQPDGSPLAAAAVWQPRATNYPTTCWPPGTVISDEITLDLPPDAPPGDWWLSLAAFSDATGVERLPVTLPDGASDTQVGLGPIAVE